MALHHFHSSEFERGDRNWLRDMSPSLLVRLDVARNLWRRPIRISPHPRALGREDGDSTSQHNIERWGTVRAADIIPDGIISEDSARAFYMLCRDVGFTGIGFYPGWAPSAGFHVDVRAGVNPAEPATWGVVVMPNGDTVNTSIGDALAALF